MGDGPSKLAGVSENCVLYGIEDRSKLVAVLEESGELEQFSCRLDGETATLASIPADDLSRVEHIHCKRIELCTNGCKYHTEYQP